MKYSILGTLNNALEIINEKEGGRLSSIIDNIKKYGMHSLYKYKYIEYNELFDEYTFFHKDGDISIFRVKEDDDVKYIYETVYMCFDYRDEDLKYMTLREFARINGKLSREIILRDDILQTFTFEKFYCKSYPEGDDYEYKASFEKLGNGKKKILYGDKEYDTVLTENGYEYICKDLKNNEVIEKCKTHIHKVDGKEYDYQRYDRDEYSMRRVYPLYDSDSYEEFKLKEHKPFNITEYIFNKEYGKYDTIIKDGISISNKEINIRINGEMYRFYLYKELSVDQILELSDHKEFMKEIEIIEE